MRRVSERDPGKSKEDAKNDGKQHLRNGEFGFGPIYWQEPTVSHPSWKDCHCGFVVGGVGGLNGWSAADCGGEQNPLDRDHDDC